MKNNFLNEAASKAISLLSQRIRQPNRGPVKSGMFIAGRTAPEAFALYKSVSQGGIIKTCHFCVEIEPYNRAGTMANSADIHLFRRAGEPFNHRWLLITQADWPILQADTESQKVAGYQSNRITGRQSGEFTLSFLDNKAADILNSLKAIEGFIFNGDGTQNPPADYAIVMTPYLFDAKNHKTKLYAKPMLVALQAVQASTSAEHNPLEVSTTWMQLDPFMQR